MFNRNAVYFSIWICLLTIATPTKSAERRLKAFAFWTSLTFLAAEVDHTGMHLESTQHHECDVIGRDPFSSSSFREGPMMRYHSYLHEFSVHSLNKCSSPAFVIVHRAAKSHRHSRTHCSFLGPWPFPACAGSERRTTAKRVFLYIYIYIYIC